MGRSPDPKDGERKAVRWLKAGGDAYCPIQAFAAHGSMTIPRAKQVAKANGFVVFKRPNSGEWVADHKWHAKCLQWDKEG